MGNIRKIHTCGCKWGNGNISYAELFLEKGLAILGEGAHGIDSFREITTDCLIALKDGHSILALGIVNSEVKRGTWRDLLNEKDIDRFNVGADGNINYYEIKHWIPIKDVTYETQSGANWIQDNKVHNELMGFYQNYRKEQVMQDKITILKQKKQIILQGAPGTGKTYATAEIAVQIINDSVASGRKMLMKEYQKLVDGKRIFFTTFHQSMDYEEFVEGYKPIEGGGFELKNGIFKKACAKADELYQKSLLQGESDEITIDDAIEIFYEYLRELPLREEDTGQMDLETKEGYKFHIHLNTDDRLKIRASSSELWHSCKLITYYNELKRGGVSAYAYPILKYLEKNYKLVDKEKLDELAQNKKNVQSNNVVLIIDEINRGNISKIFGELITLLEADKRIGEINAIKADLPYSEESEESFGVPPNLYIIATMNTADRTIGYIDYALRRRFAFITMKADKSKVSSIAQGLFDKVEQIITGKGNLSPEFETEDLMIGHSYFMVENREELQIKLDYEIKPLLLEYLKDGILIEKGDNTLKNEIKNLSI